MRLSGYHKALGDEVDFTKSPYRQLDQPTYDRVYGSAIFNFSADRVETLRSEFPGAIVGGTWNPADPVTVEDITESQDAPLDYAIYDDYAVSHKTDQFTASIGFSARGCRLKCGFCVVPKKEGKPQTVATLHDIWRGDPYPRHLHLLDNDFFGQPKEQWQARIDEARAGKFKICLNQGINVRMINDESAAALATIDYRDDEFKDRRIYTAWDNIGDEKVFMRGVECMERNNIPPTHLMAYMLVGYDRRETWERVIYRFNKMVSLGIKPYPMIYDPKRTRGLPAGGYNGRVEHKTLREFQRWANRRYYTVCNFEDYDARRVEGGKQGKTPASKLQMEMTV